MQMHLADSAAESVMPCRPMAMMIPDYALVAEVMLFSEGNHYSFGLHNKLGATYIRHCSSWQQIEGLACCDQQSAQHFGLVCDTNRGNTAAHEPAAALHAVTEKCQPSLPLVVSPSTVLACRV